MSHSDRLHSLPENFSVIATTENAPFAALAHNSKPLYGIQFHPEVTHSPRGKEVLERFVVNICECKREWTMVRPRCVSDARSRLTLALVIGRVHRQGDCQDQGARWSHGASHWCRQWRSRLFRRGQAHARGHR